MPGAPIRDPEDMETTADLPTGGAAPNPRDEEPPPEPPRTEATIEEHRFQRPIVSPVAEGSVPRDG